MTVRLTVSFCRLYPVEGLVYVVVFRCVSDSNWVQKQTLTSGLCSETDICLVGESTQRK